MARTVVKLTPAQIEKLTGKPGSGTWYSEGSVPGLNLYVSDKGARSWRLRYRLDGKAAVFVIDKAGKEGISRDEAQERAKEAIALVKQGIHPLKAKNAAQGLPGASDDKPKVPRTFRGAADEWLNHKGPEIRGRTLERYRSLLEVHAFPVIGAMPLADVGIKELRRITESQTEFPTAVRKAFWLVGKVYEHCVLQEYCESNPVEGKRGLLHKHKGGSHAAFIEPQQVGDFLLRLDREDGKHGGTWGLAINVLRLLVVLPVRVSELAEMKWSQIDWQASQWKYTVGKTQRAFVMPLPRQALKMLEGLKAQANGSELVFPSGLKRGGHINPSFVRLTLVEKLGYGVGEVTCHGFRTTHRTLCQEQLDIDPVILELNLGHLMPGPMGERYARATMLPQRAGAMQSWADYLDQLREKAKSQAA